MEAARHLLHTHASTLAILLRYELVGLRASLAQALAEHPDDAGVAACRGLLVELRGLLDSCGERDAGLATSTAELPELVRQPDALADVLVEFARRPVAPGWLVGLGPETPTVELWRRSHLASLRLPPSHAREWRTVVADAVAELDLKTDDSWHTLPASDDTVLVPPVAGEPGWRTSVQAPVAADIAENLHIDPTHSSGSDRWILATLATTVVGLAEVDDDLWLGLESVRYHGLGRLDDSTRLVYRRDLLDRLAAYAQETPGSTASFEALLLVDEALNSIVHRPVAAPGSWWAQLGEQSRALVFHAQQDHSDVSVQLLARQYREAKAMTDGNDVRVDGAGGTGTVLACLRLWARVEGKELPGRVMYAG